VAHWLRDRGYEAYAVRGGAAALIGGAPIELRAEDVGGAPAARPLEALRYASFRRYSTGVLLSLIGSAVEASAYGYVVLLLGGSPATLGVIGFLNTIPNLLFALPAGALAARHDRRTILFVFQTANLLLALALAVLWATDSLTLTLLGALAVLGGILGTMSFPPFQGLLAATVPARDLESAVALNSLSLQLARFVGPALAGFLLAQAGPTWVFGFNALSFVGVLAALAMLKPARPQHSQPGIPTGSMGEAFRFLFQQRSLSGLIAFLVLAGLFGTPPVQFMIPALVQDNLQGGPGTLGALSAAVGLGSVLGALALLRLSRRPNKGEPLLSGFVITALALIAVGASTSVPLSLAVGVVGGFGGVLFIGLSTVVVQAMSPDELRTRTMAIWAAAFVGVLPFGALLTGGLAAWLGTGGAVAVDGVAMLVGATFVLALRPQIAWLGCASLPEACIAATNPLTLAVLNPSAELQHPAGSSKSGSSL
jgi:MFS family permease